MHDLAPALWVCIGRMGCAPNLWDGMSNHSNFTMVELSRKMQSIRTPEGWDKLPWAAKNFLLNGVYLWDKHVRLYSLPAYGRMANFLDVLSSLSYTGKLSTKSGFFAQSTMKHLHSLTCWLCRPFRTSQLRMLRQKQTF